MMILKNFKRGFNKKLAVLISYKKYVQDKLTDKKEYEYLLKFLMYKICY